jgi:hypothetical protein
VEYVKPWNVILYRWEATARFGASGRPLVVITGRCPVLVIPPRLGLLSISGNKRYRQQLILPHRGVKESRVSIGMGTAYDEALLKRVP